MSIASKFMYLKAEFDLLVKLSLWFFCSHFELFCLFRIISLIIHDRVYFFESFKVLYYSEKICMQPLQYLKKQLMPQAWENCAGQTWSPSTTKKPAWLMSSEQETVDIVWLDFSKDFGMVSHSLLPQKLTHYSLSK